MKGLSIRLLAAAALLVTAVTPAGAFDFFGLLAKRGPSMETLLTSVPADTVVFLGGHTSSGTAPFFDGYMGSTSEADIAELKTLMLSQADTPGMNILGWLLEDYFAVVNEGYAATTERYGMAEDGAGVFYLDGALPVARYVVDDADALWALLDQAESETGANARTSELAGTQVRRWTVTQDDAPVSLDLAVAIGDGVASFALLNAVEPAERQAQRLGLTDIDGTLAEAGTWRALEERYGFDRQLRGYVDLAGLAESLLIPANTSLGRDLSQMAPDMTERMGAELGAVCRDEFVGLARQVPRAVIGSERHQVSADALQQSVRMVLELTNSQVTGELRKLPGSLPDYAQLADDKLLAFALGIDVDTLAPVATALWTRFRSADFECATLIEWQARAQSANPAMLGMVSGMAQGVKGIGAALFSLAADERGPAGLSGSALVSLSAQNPQTIAALVAASVPGLAGVTLPPDGEAVEIPVPVPNLPVYAAIKGQHLVVYTGDPARAAAENLADEPLNTDGVSALAVNYQGVGEAMLTALSVPEIATRLTLTEGVSDCTDPYTAFVQLKEHPITLNYRDSFTENGWEAWANVSVGNDDRAIDVQPGEYQTHTLDYDCGWSRSGTEILNSDGTGRYTESSAQCDLYVNEFRWRQKGSLISQEGTDERSRDTCDAEWTRPTPQSFQCTLVGTLDRGFYCLYHFDGEPVLMRYTR